MGLWNGFVAKIKNTANRWSRDVSNLFSDRPITDVFWEELEEVLISGDVGMETTESLIDDLRTLSLDNRIAHQLPDRKSVV